MSKFQDRLKRLHSSRLRALEESRHEAESRVFLADDATEVVPRVSWSDALGARRCEGYSLVEQRFQGPDMHGRYALDASLAVEVPLAIDDQLRLFSRDAHPVDFGYFDIETSGLGRDSVAFCVGLGVWEGDEFVVRQYAMESADDERAMLVAFADSMEVVGALVSFNGRSFDVPRMNARFEAHGLASPFEGLEHVDLLHAARRFFPRRNPLTLGELERSFVMFHRHGDVPGSEAPRRWKAYVDSGHLNPSELGALFDHNRLDILSLVSLLVHFDQMVSSKVSPERGSAVPTPPPRALASREVSSKGDISSPGEQVSSSLTAQLKKTYRLKQGRVVRGGAAAHPGRPEPRPEVPGHPRTTSADDVFGDVGGRVGALRREAMALLESHRFDEAVPVLHEMIALSPRNPYPVAQLARYYRLIGDEALAELFESRLKGLAPY